MACHAVVIVIAVFRMDGEDRSEGLPEPPTVTIEVIDQQIVQPLNTPPMAVALVDLDSIPVPFSSIAPPEQRPRKRTKTKSIATTTQPSTATIESTTQPSIEPRSKYLTMRGIERNDRSIDLRLPEHYRIAERIPEGTKPEVPVETGKLKPGGRGTHKSDEGTFVAKVERDGSVSITDKGNLQVGQRPRLGKPKTWIPLVAGSFDVTDALLRSKKQDPYFSKKLKYLDTTRDERVAIGSRYRKEHLAQSAQLMQKSLAMLPADPAARKQALFELWDDCAEVGDNALVEGGRAARALVIGYIRGKHAAGTEHAFTANELTAFNSKRQSKTAFAPY